MWQKENRINIQELNSKVCAFGFILYQKRFYKIVYYGIRLLWINCNKVYTCTKTCTKALFAVSKQWSPKKNNTPGICLLKHLFYCSEKKYTGLYVSFFKYYVHNSSWLNWTEKIYKHYYCTAIFLFTNKTCNLCESHTLNT